MNDGGTSEDGGRFVAFAGGVRVAGGALVQAAAAARRALDRDPGSAVLVFDGTTGQVVDLDLRGTEAEVAARYAPAPPAAGSRRGRPKLGVVAREVTLLPRHWDWLAGQPGGASVALRRLVEAARKAEGEAGAARARQTAAYGFMSAMAGDRPGFEEASRALFAGDHARLAQSAQSWPPDILDQVLRYLKGPAEEPAAAP